MADFKEESRGVYEELAKVLKEYHGNWDGLEYIKKSGELIFYINDEAYKFRPSDEEEEVSVGGLTVTVNADVGDAIKGFKALQRELRKTAQEARELESAYNDLKSVQFVDEDLAKREDVQCPECDGSGIVSIGEGIRGVKKCDRCHAE